MDLTLEYHHKLLYQHMIMVEVVLSLKEQQEWGIHDQPIVLILQVMLPNMSQPEEQPQIMLQGLMTMYEN